MSIDKANRPVGGGTGTAAPGRPVTVQVNGKPVDLPERPDGMWPMPDIAHFAFASGAIPMDGAPRAARTPDDQAGPGGWSPPTCPKPPCHCGEAMSMHLQGGEQFDYMAPQMR